MGRQMCSGETPAESWHQEGRLGVVREAFPEEETLELRPETEGLRGSCVGEGLAQRPWGRTEWVHGRGRWVAGEKWAGGEAQAHSQIQPKSSGAEGMEQSR